MLKSVIDLHAAFPFFIDEKKEGTYTVSYRIR